MKLYRYYSNRKYFREVFQECSLYFNSFKNFNDPYEAFTFLKDTKSDEVYADIECKDVVKACCFSKTYSNYLMWSHYGKSHQGYCIEFDFPNLEFEKEVDSISKIMLDGKMVHAFSVEYSPYLVEAEKKSSNHFNRQQTINILSHKYDIWDYEQEYRFIVFSNDCIKIRIPKEAITGVYYALNVTESELTKEKKYISKLGYRIFHRKLGLGLDGDKLVLDHNFVNLSGSRI